MCGASAVASCLAWQSTPSILTMVAFHRTLSDNGESQLRELLISSSSALANTAREWGSLSSPMEKENKGLGTRQPKSYNFII